MSDVVTSLPSRMVKGPYSELVTGNVVGELRQKAIWRHDYETIRTLDGRTNRLEFPGYKSRQG